MIKILSKMGSKIMFKMGSNPERFGLQGWFGAPGRPPEAKMAQDARQVVSGAAFLELLSFILALRWAKIASRWAKLEPS